MTTENELKLAWLAGIIDGEGCISFYIEKSRYTRQDGVKNTALKLQVHVANTDERIINEVASIAHSFDVPCQVKAVPTSQRGRAKMRMDVVFAGAKRAKAILSLVLPYLVGKRDRAILALRVIEHRQSTRTRKQVEIKHDEWLNAQLAEWRTLNRRGVY